MMLKYIAICLVVGGLACTPGERAAESAKAQACFESPALHMCEVQALADCVVAGTCEERSAAESFFGCLRVCRSSGDDGAAGASGE